MNNQTSKNILIALAFVFVIGFAGKAHAYVPGVWDPKPRLNTGESSFTTVIQSSNTPTVVTQVSTPVATTHPVQTVAPTKVAQTAPTRNTTVRPTTRPMVQNEYATDNGFRVVETAPNNQLTALSVNGSGGFMPSSLLQWFLVVLLILAIIIIARMLRKPEHHDVHAVHAH